MPVGTRAAIELVVAPGLQDAVARSRQRQKIGALGAARGRRRCLVGRSGDDPAEGLPIGARPVVDRDVIADRQAQRADPVTPCLRERGGPIDPVPLVGLRPPEGGQARRPSPSPQVCRAEQPVTVPGDRRTEPA